MDNLEIPDKLFIKNRLKLRKMLLPESVLILFSADEMPRNGDQYFPYRQSSDFFYLTGINQEKTILVMNPQHHEEKYHEMLFILNGTSESDIWYGPKLTMEEVTTISGIKNIFWYDDFEKLLPEIVLRSKNIYLNIPDQYKVKAEVESRDERMTRKIQALFPLHTYQRLAPLLRKLRMIKEPEEIMLIRRACSITRDAFLRVLDFISPGVMEYQVKAEITHEFLRQGASGHAYEPIIAGGMNACILHYIKNDKPCNDGDLVLMDFGAEYKNYAADLTRTVPVNGIFTKRQAQIYDANLRVLKLAISLMNPGILMADFHSEVCRLWQEEHIRLGLYSESDVKKNDAQQPVWFRYFMHGTSHAIGLDVHDPFDKTEKFLPGMVLSCEPSIYLKEEGLGIRLENDILITENGNEDLMKDVLVEREEIEELMNRG